VSREVLMTQEFIKNPLKFSNIILFKATRLNVDSVMLEYQQELSNYRLKLPNNNIENIMVDESLLKVINLDCDHLHILELSNQISEFIKFLIMI
jgi:hypothetical protein